MLFVTWIVISENTIYIHIYIIMCNFLSLNFGMQISLRYFPSPLAKGITIKYLQMYESKKKPDIK